MRLFITSLLVVCVVGIAGGLAGCNTVKGFGKDLSKTGHAIEKAATH